MLITIYPIRPALTFMKSSFLVLSLCFCVRAAAAGDIPIERLGFKSKQVEAANRAALLCTPEQTAALENAWRERGQAVVQIRRSRPKLSLEENKKIWELERKFNESRDQILTDEQREVILQLNSVTVARAREVDFEFKSQFDTAQSGEEKAALTIARNKTLIDRMLDELSSSLDAKRFAAFKAALGR